MRMWDETARIDVVIRRLICTALGALLLATAVAQGRALLDSEGDLLPPCYHTEDEVNSELMGYVAAYPSIAQAESIGVSTEDHRTIYAVKISDNVLMDEDEPSILYTGAFHAEEVLGVEICMEAIDELLTLYDVDPWITSRVNNYEIWFIPMMNPDGHHLVASGIDREWRKNTRDNNDNGQWDQTCDGVDLNRNFPYFWDGSGASDDSTAYNYRGPYPLSESECVAMKELCERERFVLGINYHSPAHIVGDCVYYCWWERETEDFSPDFDVISDIASGLSEHIMREDGEDHYDAIYGYLNSGKARNWQYAVMACFAYTVEVGSHECQPPCDRVPGIVEDNLQGLFWLMDRLAGPGLTGVVTDSLTGQPIVAEVQVLENHDPFYLSPRMSDPVYGRYRRPLLPGPYTVRVSAPPHYQTRTYNGVTVTSGDWTVFDVALPPKDPAEVVAVYDQMTTRLEQNAPNPLDAGTAIRFSLKEGTEIALHIYDSRGRHVATPARGYYEHGEHLVRWDGRGPDGHRLSAGVYFYYLAGTEQVKARKLLMNP